MGVHDMVSLWFGTHRGAVRYRVFVCVCIQNYIYIHVHAIRSQEPKHPPLPTTKPIKPPEHGQGWTERRIFGKIRYMNYDGCKRKFDVDGFCRRYPRSIANAKAAAGVGRGAGPVPVGKGGGGGGGGEEAEGKKKKANK